MANFKILLIKDEEQVAWQPTLEHQPTSIHSLQKTIAKILTTTGQLFNETNTKLQKKTYSTKSMTELNKAKGNHPSNKKSSVIRSNEEDNSNQTQLK